MNITDYVTSHYCMNKAILPTILTALGIFSLCSCVDPNYYGASYGYTGSATITSLPYGYHTVYVSGTPYYYFGTTWYRRHGSHYITCPRPHGYHGNLGKYHHHNLSHLPHGYQTTYIGGHRYYTHGNTWYRKSGSGYVTCPKPSGHSSYKPKSHPHRSYRDKDRHRSSHHPTSSHYRHSDHDTGQRHRRQHDDTRTKAGNHDREASPHQRPTSRPDTKSGARQHPSRPAEFITTKQHNASGKPAIAKTSPLRTAPGHMKRPDKPAEASSSGKPPGHARTARH
jgi:hypothetical protein